MNKIINAKLQIIKNVILMLMFSFVIYNLSFIIPTFAKDSSPSASLSPIQQKLQDLKQEIASKAAAIKTEISQKISNKAYAGAISQITDVKQNKTASSSAKLITITTAKGTRTVITNDYTAYQDPSVKKGITVKNFSPGDFIAALGEVDDNQVLTAKKIIRTKPPQTVSTDAIWGQIQSVNPSTIFVVNRENKKIAVALTNNTDIKVASDEASIKDVIPGNFLISIGSVPQTNRSVSDFIYLINPDGKLKITSPSATPSASASASPSASPKKK